jgi:hypothetical protein
MRCLFGILVLAALMVLVTIVIAQVLEGVAREDSLFWNCYLMGNHQCGNVDQVVGFTLGRE